jgi:hypothetical protein
LADPIIIDFDDQEPPVASAANLIVIDDEMHDREFIEGSSTGTGLVFLGHINLCTPSPPPEMQDHEFIQGSSSGAGLRPR